MEATLYMSKKGFDYNTLKEVVAEHSKFGDVDCTIYKNESFTAWRFEEGAKITFFNIDNTRLWNIYLALRDKIGLNCTVLETDSYFGCIVKSELNDNTHWLVCSDD